MKIVYFIDHLRGDGTQRVLAQLVEGLSARGHAQAVVCLNDSWSETILNRLQGAGVQIRIVGKFALLNGVGSLSTLKWLRREKFDVAVAFLFAADVLGRALAHAANVPRIVSSLRARNVQYARWQRWLVRCTMHWVDAVVLNSASFRQFAMEAEGAAANHICIIPNGVQITEPQCSGRDYLRAELGLDGETFLIGGAGRLTFQKGFDLLIQALAQVECVDVHLIIFGKGEAEADLRVAAQRLGLHDRVHFGGYRQDTQCLFNALDLYVHPARWEGMPNALLEAMAAGCPIVATRVDGISDLIQDGEQGWLVPPNDPRALAQAIEAARNHPAAARCRAAAAQQRAATEFSIDQMVARWEKVLLGVPQTMASGQAL